MRCGDEGAPQVPAGGGMYCEAAKDMAGHGQWGRVAVNGFKELRLIFPSRTAKQQPIIPTHKY